MGDDGVGVVFLICFSVVAALRPLTFAVVAISDLCRPVCIRFKGQVQTCPAVALASHALKTVLA